MNAQEIQEEIRKNLKNAEGVLKYISSPSFREKAGATPKKLFEFATNTSRDALKLAQDVSGKAFDGAAELRKNVEDQAKSLVSEIRTNAGELLESIKSAAKSDEPAGPRA